MIEDKTNPYESPKTPPPTPPATTRSTIGSTILVIVLSILSVLAGVIVFFVVCFGTGLAGISFLDKSGGSDFPSPEVVFLLAILFGSACGIGTVLMLGRRIYKSRVKLIDKRDAADSAKELKDR